MTMSPDVTEDDLHAYVDGALAPDRREQIERHLTLDAEAARRVAAFTMQRAALRAALAPIAAEPIPPALDLAAMIERRRRPSPRVSWLDGWRTAVAAVLILGIGGAGGWTMRGDRPARVPGGVMALVQEASDTYAAFAPDRVHPVEFRANDKDEMLRWIGDRLHRTVMAPDLTASGYRFMGGRLVATPHGPAGMLMYDDDHGTRIAMLVRPMASDATTPMTEHADGDMMGFAWADRGMGYSLVGPKATDTLHPLADEMRRQIDRSV